MAIRPRSMFPDVDFMILIPDNQLEKIEATSSESIKMTTSVLIHLREAGILDVPEEIQTDAISQDWSCCG